MRGQSLYEKYVTPPLALGHWGCALLPVLDAGALQLGATAPAGSAFPSLPSLLSHWEMLLPQPCHSCRTTRVLQGMGQFYCELMDAPKGSSPHAGSGMWYREVQCERSWDEHIQCPFPALFQPSRVGNTRTYVPPKSARYGFFRTLMGLGPCPLLSLFAKFLMGKVIPRE